MMRFILRRFLCWVLTKHVPAGAAPFFACRCGARTIRQAPGATWAGVDSRLE